MTLITLNANTYEPIDYINRSVVKAVIKNTTGKILLLSSGLVGGGVENGETDEQALMREIIEETGMEITIIKPIGQVIAYRDFLKQKYSTNGYLCEYVQTTSTPTTLDSDELKMKLFWEYPLESIDRLEKEIQELESKDRESYNDDTYQRKLYNRKTALAFIKEIL